MCQRMHLPYSDLYKENRSDCLLIRQAPPIRRNQGSNCFNFLSENENGHNTGKQKIKKSR